MPDSISILLLSPDLMVSSRIAGVAESIPATVEALGPAAAAPRGGPFAVIVVDLQVNGRTATALVERAKGLRDAQAAAGAERAAIIAFGPPKRGPTSSSAGENCSVPCQRSSNGYDRPCEKAAPTALRDQ